MNMVIQQYLSKKKKDWEIMCISTRHKAGKSKSVICTNFMCQYHSQNDSRISEIVTFGLAADGIATMKWLLRSYGKSLLLR